MKLNKDIRRKLVLSIIADVPKFDYQTEITQLIQKLAFDALPPSVKAVPIDDLRTYLEPSYIRACENVSVYVFNRLFFIDDILLDKDHELTKLIKAHKEQLDSFDKLERGLRVSIGAVNSTKQLAEKYPDFMKYLDIKEETSNLPATPIIEQLVKAGWKIT